MIVMLFRGSSFICALCAFRAAVFFRFRSTGIGFMEM